MRNRKKERIVKATLTGMIGGLVASWAMNQFQSGMQKVEKEFKKPEEQQQQLSQQSSQDSEDATMKTANRLTRVFTHHELTKEQKKKAGPIVHYAYGALLGGAYGLLGELFPVVRLGAGTAFASAAWLLGDEIAVPQLGLSDSPLKYPVSSHAKALAAHLAYGVSLDGAQRALKAVV